MSMLIPIPILRKKRIGIEIGIEIEMVVVRRIGIEIVVVRRIEIRIGIVVVRTFGIEIGIGSKHSRLK